MFIPIPMDVVILIINYLDFFIDESKYFCISKKFTHELKKTDRWKNLKQLTEHVSILFEEKQKYIYSENIDLGNKWIKMYKIRWPSLSDVRKKNKISSPLWKIGDYVDVKDCINSWNPGIIKKIIYENENITLLDQFLRMTSNRIILSGKKYLIEFLGWTDSFNEYITVDKIARLGTHTIHPDYTFESLKKDIFVWCLFKYDNVWQYLNIKLLESSNEVEKKIKVGTETIILTRKNIKNYIRYISNVNAFLSNTSTTFCPCNRILKY